MANLFENKTQPPTPEEDSVHVVMSRGDEFMNANLADLQRKRPDVSVAHVERPRKGHAY